MTAGLPTRKAALAVLTVALLAAVGAAALFLRTADTSPAAASTSGAGRTLHFLQKHQVDHIIDNPPRTTFRHGVPASISIGDMDLVTKEIWTTSKPTRQVGTIYALCTVTIGGLDPAVTCNGSYVLPSGTLAMSAFYHFSDRAHRAAVVGGTGAYAGARGSYIGVSSPGNDAINIDTIHLLP